MSWYFIHSFTFIFPSAYICILIYMSLIFSCSHSCIRTCMYYSFVFVSALYVSMKQRTCLQYVEEGCKQKRKLLIDNKLEGILLTEFKLKTGMILYFLLDVSRHLATLITGMTIDNTSGCRRVPDSPPPSE